MIKSLKDTNKIIVIVRKITFKIKRKNVNAEKNQIPKASSDYNNFY